MKKVLPIFIVLALLGVGGYFYLSSRGMFDKFPPGDIGEITTGGNVITSIKDALSGSMSLKCVYADDQGTETTTYVKGGAVRVMMAAGADANQPNNIIMKEKTMHMWNDTNKTGIILKLEEPATEIAEDVSEGEKLEAKANPQTGDDQQESVLAQIEKFKDACKAENVNDSLFSPPLDVQFQDMEALQKQMMQETPNQEDIQKMIQQQNSSEDE